MWCNALDVFFIHMASFRDALEKLPSPQDIYLAHDCMSGYGDLCSQFSVSSSSSFCFFLSASHCWIFSLSSLFGLIWSIVSGLRLKGSVWSLKESIEEITFTAHLPGKEKKTDQEDWCNPPAVKWSELSQHWAHVSLGIIRQVKYITPRLYTPPYPKLPTWKSTSPCPMKSSPWQKGSLIWTRMHLSLHFIPE